MLFVFIQGRCVANIVEQTVDAYPDEAFALYIGQNVLVLAFLAADQRGAYLDFRAFRPGKYRIDYL